MANKQTRSLKTVNTSTKVGKGTFFRITRSSNSGAVGEGALSFQSFPSTKGEAVNSSKRREANGKKPWQGAMKQAPKNLRAALEKSAE